MGPEVRDERGRGGMRNVSAICNQVLWNLVTFFESTKALSDHNKPPLAIFVISGSSVTFVG